MGTLVAYSRVHASDSFGRFIAECELAAQTTIEEAVHDGADLSAQLAPKRTGALAASITPVVLSRTSGAWGSDLKYALPQETGAGPHLLPGDVAFFWEEEGRWWEPGPNLIHHPGNEAQPYLRPAFEYVMSNILRIADRHYPG